MVLDRCIVSLLTFGVGSMDPPDRTCRPSSEGVGPGGGVSG